MKRIFSILLAALFLLALSSASSETLPDGFALPESFRTVDARLDRGRLPADLPAPAVITAAAFSGSSLSVEISGPVPSLSILQFDENGDPVIAASAENAASLKADKIDASEGMADVVLSWPLSGGELISTWSVWEDSSFDFVQCQYVSETGERIIEMDAQLTVLSDVFTLSGDLDSFSVLCTYDASGALTDYTCEWMKGEDGTWLSVTATAEQVLTAVSFHNADTDFIAVSDPFSRYLAGEGAVLEAVDYSDSFISSLSRQYSQLPEPNLDYPDPLQAVSTPTDIADEPGIQGLLWAVISGAEEDSSTIVPFASADPLFLFSEGRVALNAEAKDLNSAAPDFGKLIPALPELELPEVR